MLLPWSLNRSYPPPSLALLPGGPGPAYAGSGQLAGSYGESTTTTRATSKTCFDGNAKLFTVGNDTAAVDPEGVSLEGARTNLVLNNRDFTTGSWTKTNVTAAKTATGLDAAANSASTLTATAGNGTALQAITVGAATRCTSFYVKRRTGTGTIEITRDNGTSWTAITGSLSSTVWTRFNLTSGIANPTVGFRIGTNGDAIDVDYIQDEAGAFPTSAIATAGTSVTRNKDALVMSVSALPVTSGFFQLDFTPRWSTNAGATLIDTRDGAGNNGVAMYVQSDTLVFINGAGSFAQSPAQVWVPNQTYRLRAIFRNTTIAISRNDIEIGGNAAATMPTGHTAFRLGDGFAASSPLDGWIRNFSCGRL